MKEEIKEMPYINPRAHRTVFYMVMLVIMLYTTGQLLGEQLKTSLTLQFAMQYLGATGIIMILMDFFGEMNLKENKYYKIAYRNEKWIVLATAIIMYTIGRI